ncbi:hypothetical protein BG004_002604 [Podila humilis]|nr:hypothetical protein BG004_002604 [Podila humilis]
MSPQVKDFEEFLAQAMTSSSTTTISASPDLPSVAVPEASHDHTDTLDSLEEDQRIDDSFYDNLSFQDASAPSPTPPSSRSHAIFLNPHSAELTPMELVSVSNLKLNNEMFSNRSLSIQKRILVKNLLTQLYQLYPPPLPQEWMHHQQESDGQDQAQEELQPNGGQADKQGSRWGEQTLDAAGLTRDNTHGNQEPPSSPSLTPTQSLGNPFTKSNNNNTFNKTTNSLSPSSPDSGAGDSPIVKVPLPRPKSTDLPQSLHSYLSTVFDVDWSVGLSNTEDSLFTLHGAGSSSSLGHSGSGLLSTGSGTGPLSSSPKRKSLSASSSLSLSLSLSDFVSTGNNGPNGGNSNHGSWSSTSSNTSSSTKSSVPAGSSVSSSAGSVGGALKNNINIRGSPAAPLTRKSSLPSTNVKNTNQGNKNIDGHNNNSNNSNTNGVASRDSAYSNGNTQGENVAINSSISGRKQGINTSPKPMMVPGRRSSLLQTGKMPTSVNNSTNASSHRSPSINTFTAQPKTGSAMTNTNITPVTPISISSPTLSPYSYAPAQSPSLSPTLSPTSSGGSFANGAPTSPSLSPTLSPASMKPAISRRTSSLPAERPIRHNQRLPSSENGLPTVSSLATVSGLPRPLQNTTLSTLSSSPPSPSTLAPVAFSQKQNQHLKSGPYPYSRSVSDEHIQSVNSYSQQQYTKYDGVTSLSSSSSSSSSSERGGGGGYFGSTGTGSFSGTKSTPSSPSLAPPSSLPPIPLSYPASAATTSTPSFMASSTTLAKPLPSYTLNNASKSSPNLVTGGNFGSSQDSMGLDQQYHNQQFYHRQQPPLPQQQQQQMTTFGQFSSTTDKLLAASNGINKLLSRTSSRRGAVGNTTPESYATKYNGGGSGSGATSIGAAMTISAPLSLVSSSSSSTDDHGYKYQPSSSQTHVFKSQYQLDPYSTAQPRSQNGHSHASSVSSMHSINSLTGHGGSSGAGNGGGGSGGGGKWNSMKTMLGLRVGQGAKG